jgi:hypothetical protein
LAGNFTLNSLNQSGGVAASMGFKQFPLTSSTNASNVVVSESLCSASTINISNSVDLVSLRPNSQFSPLDLSSNFNSSQTNAATTVLGVIAGVITTRSQMKLETDTDSYQDSISNVAFGIESLITNGVGSGEMAATVSNHGSTTSSSTTTNTDAKLQHNQTQSQPQQQQQLRRKDKLDSTEIKDLLACFIYLLSSLSEDLLLGLALVNLESDYLTLLEVCLKTFKYRGKSNITKLNVISGSPPPPPDPAPIDQDLVEANMCFRCSASVLNQLNLILTHLKDKLTSSLKTQIIELLFFLLESS